MKKFITKFAMLAMLIALSAALAPLALAEKAAEKKSDTKAKKASTATSTPAPAAVQPPTQAMTEATESKPPVSEELLTADDKLPFMHQEEVQAGDTMSTGGIIAKTLGAMLVIVGLIFFGAWGLKKMGFGSKASGDDDAPELAIVSSVTVGNGRTISSVKFGNRVLLVGSTPQSFTLLADSADSMDGFDPANPFPVASPRSVAELLEEEVSFEKELARADSGLISLFNGGRA